MAFSANYSPAVAALNGSGTPRFTSSLKTGYRAGFCVLERELKTSPTVPVCTFPLSFFFFFFWHWACRGSGSFVLLGTCVTPGGFN